MRWLALLLLLVGTATADEPATRTIPPEDLAAAALAPLQAELPGTGLTVVSVAGPVRVLATGDVTLQGEPLTRERSGRVPVRVRVLAGEREVGRSLVVVAVRRVRPVLVLTAPVSRGSPIGLESLQREERDQPPGRADPLSDPGLLVGQVAARDLPAGTVLAAQHLTRPPAVRPGPVTLLFRRDGMELAATGQATGGGAVGDLVPVRRPDGTLVRGRVLGPGQVLLNY